MHIEKLRNIVLTVFAVGFFISAVPRFVIPEKTVARLYELTPQQLADWKNVVKEAFSVQLLLLSMGLGFYFARILEPKQRAEATNTGEIPKAPATIFIMLTLFFTLMVNIKSFSPYFSEEFTAFRTELYALLCIGLGYLFKK